MNYVSEESQEKSLGSEREIKNECGGNEGGNKRKRAKSGAEIARTRIMLSLCVSCKHTHLVD